MLRLQPSPQARPLRPWLSRRKRLGSAAPGCGGPGATRASAELGGRGGGERGCGETHTPPSQSLAPPHYNQDQGVSIDAERPHTPPALSTQQAATAPGTRNDELHITAEALPCQKALHVRVQLMPQCGLPEASLQPGRQAQSEVSSQLSYHPAAAPPRTTYLAGCSLQGLLVWRGHKEAHGGHGSLTAGAAGAPSSECCAGPSIWHSSPLCTVACSQSRHCVATPSPSMAPAHQAGPSPPPACSRKQPAVHAAPCGLGGAAGRELANSLARLARPERCPLYSFSWSSSSCRSGGGGRGGPHPRGPPCLPQEMHTRPHCPTMS